MKKIAGGLVVASAALVLVTSSPSFGVPNKDVFPLDCGSAGEFDVSVNGNGEFTPAHDTGSTRVVVPISFQNFHFTATAPDGTVLVDETDPGVEAKGGGNVARHNPRDQVTCTFGGSDVLTEEEDGLPAGTTVSYSGEVTGYLTQAK